MARHQLRRMSKISIHAPHARSDVFQPFFQHLCKYFNPRSSCEERLRLAGDTPDGEQFQSTLLMRGATWAAL